MEGVARELEECSTVSQAPGPAGDGAAELLHRTLRKQSQQMEGNI